MTEDDSVSKLEAIQCLNTRSMLILLSAGSVGRIETKKIDFTKKAKPKVNSFGNIGHVPGGGRVKVTRNN